MQRICAWDFGLTCLADPHRLEKIPPSQTSLKNGPTEAGLGTRGCFLTPVVKAAHKPVQAGQRGQFVFTATSLHNSSFFWACSQSFFLVYAAQFLHRAIFPSSTLITFCRTLLEYYGSLFCFLRCDRMRFLKLPQNWPK